MVNNKKQTENKLKTVLYFCVIIEYYTIILPKAKNPLCNFTFQTVTGELTDGNLQKHLSKSLQFLHKKFCTYSITLTNQLKIKSLT